MPISLASPPNQKLLSLKKQQHHTTPSPAPENQNLIFDIEYLDDWGGLSGSDAGARSVVTCLGGSRNNTEKRRRM